MDLAFVQTWKGHVMLYTKKWKTATSEDFADLITVGLINGMKNISNMDKVDLQLFFINPIGDKKNSILWEQGNLTKKDATSECPPNKILDFVHEKTDSVSLLYFLKQKNAKLSYLNDLLTVAKVLCWKGFLLESSSQVKIDGTTRGGSWELEFEFLANGVTRESGIRPVLTPEPMAYRGGW